MSWSDDTRCLFCDGKLPLYRKLTNGQFCSTAHQKEYWKEQERLAVEVLHRTHDALMAYRPQEDVELIIGPAVGWNGQAPATPKEAARTEPTPPPSVRQHQQHQPVEHQRVEHRHVEPRHVEERIVPQPARSSVQPESIPFSTPAGAPQSETLPPFATFVVAVSPEGLSPKWTVLPLLLAAEPAHYETVFFDVLPVSENDALVLEVNPLPISVDPVAVPVQAAAIAWPIADPAPLSTLPVPAVVASQLEPSWPEWRLASEDTAYPPRPVLIGAVVSAPVMTSSAAEPVLFGDSAVLLEPLQTLELASLEFESQAGEDLSAIPDEGNLIPPLAGWQRRLVSIALVSCDPVVAESSSPGPIFRLSDPLKPGLGADLALRYAPALGPLQKLPLTSTVVESQMPSANWTWFRLGAFNPPQLSASSLHVNEPRVRLAGGCRYAMNGSSQILPKGSSSPANPEASPANLSTTSLVSSLVVPELVLSEPGTTLPTDFQPNFAALADLTGWKSEIPVCGIKPEPVSSRETGLTAAFPNTVWLPALRLQPLKWVPTPLGEAAQSGAGVLPKASTLAEFPAPPPPHPQIGHLLLGFWKNAPRDLRLLVFAIPALLALAFHPSLPKVHVSTVQATEPMQRNVGQAVNGSWTTFKQTVSERAAVALDEDFRSGLDDWSSPGGATTEWSFDANGFVRPGSLALYSPSQSLADYELQFLGVIDQKAISWVVRAADFSNYYVVKIVVVKPGPLTTLGLTRYAVIDGKPRDRVDTVVPFTARPDMIYRVRMDVHDDSFVLAVQGQMVDAWSEPRLRKGGVGFFSARGEGSRVRWVQVTHQYDMLGRLCSYLAPYDLSSVETLPTETTTKSNSTNNNGSWQR